MRTHWKSVYLEEYANMDLIDRKEVLEKLIEEEGIKECAAIKLINEAKSISAIDIVERYEKHVKSENELEFYMVKHDESDERIFEENNLD